MAICLGAFLGGCGSDPEKFVPEDASIDHSTGELDAGSEAAMFDGNFGDTGVSNDGSQPNPCPPEAWFIYVIASTGELYKFDPPSLEFTQIGKPNCVSNVYSMAVDRKPTAWILGTDGRIYNYDIKEDTCERTDFVPGQSSYNQFGMGFSLDGPDAGTETLYVSNNTTLTGTNSGLASIDTSTLTLTHIGEYDAIYHRAELTGTGEGRLFGAFEGTPYIVAEIDKSTGAIISQAPQETINSGTSNFAFAFWGGDFFLFVGLDVFHYEPLTGTTTKVKTVDFSIVGAGVSTCAPTTKPPPN
jgi:hypothetical protein